MTQAERTALSDARMLDVAIKCVSDRGTHNTTLKDIGELAGYNRGLASSRFGSKEAVFEELFGQFHQRWMRNLMDAVARSRGLEALLKSADAIAALFEEDPDYIRAMYLIWYETIGSSDALRRRLLDQQLMLRHEFARWLREAVEMREIVLDLDPDKVALQFAATIFGLIYQWLIDPDGVDVAVAVRNSGRDLVKLVTS